MITNNGHIHLYNLKECKYVKELKDEWGTIVGATEQYHTKQNT